MICPNCSKEIDDSSKFCPECGIAITQSSVPQQPVYNQQNETNAKPKNSGMGKLALVFSILGCTWILGLILAIIDLAHASDGRKKTCSVIALIISIIMALIVFASLSSDTDSAQTGNKANNTIEEKVIFVDESKIDNVYADADSFKGQHIVLHGQVFGEPEIDETMIYFQMYADPQISEKNTIVQFATSDLKLKSGDYVKITGEIKGFKEYKNLMGGSVFAVLIDAQALEMSNYIDCCSPTIKEIIPEDKTIDQSGYSLTIDKIEFAETETRVYVTATNNGDDKFYVYGYSMKAIQNQKQYEYKYNFYAEYEELQSELLPKTSSSGIILFDAMNPDESLQIYCEAHCDNWDIEIKPYVFEF